MIRAFRSQKKFQKKKDLRLEQEALKSLLKKSGKILQFKKNRESIAQFFEGQSIRTKIIWILQWNTVSSTTVSRLVRILVLYYITTCPKITHPPHTKKSPAIAATANERIFYNLRWGEARASWWWYICAAWWVKKVEKVAISMPFK